MGKHKNTMLSKLQVVLNRLFWEVLEELNHSMIVKHRFTGEVKVIDK